MPAMLEDFKSGTDLSIRMRELASTGHERALELYARAQELDDVVANRQASVALTVAVWARARRLWCDLTGEDLV